MIKKAFYLILFTILFTACEKRTQIILSKADEIVTINPDSALTLINELGLPYELEGKEKADYWRIRSQAHSNKRQAMTTDSLVLYSLEYYQSINDTSKILQSHLLAGMYYEWINQLDNAYQHFLEGYNEAQLANDSTYIPLLLQKLININIRKKNHPEIIHYSKKRIEWDNSHNAYYNISISRNKDMPKESVKYYIEKAIEIALKEDDKRSAAHYARNYSSILYTWDELEPSMKMIDYTGEIYDFYKDFFYNHLLKSKIYIELNLLDSTQIYLDKGVKGLTEYASGEDKELELISGKNGFAITQATLDAKLGKRIVTYEADIFNDSIINVISKKNAILKEQTREQVLLAQQSLELVIQRQRTHLIIIIVTSLLIIGSILLYLYLLKRKRKYEEIEERTETLQRLLNEALDVKDEKENNTYFFRKILLQQLGIIKLVATSPVKQNQQLLKKIVDISTETISAESLLKWDDLYPIIDTIYDNFYTKLRIRYGEILNEKEIQLCCLLCADFSTNEISATMQQSLQTIYQRKSSIRKKIEMDEKEDIILFLKEQFNS